MFIGRGFRDDQMRWLEYAEAWPRSWAAGWPGSIFVVLLRGEMWSCGGRILCAGQNGK
jgi:hypothetical protein